MLRWALKSRNTIDVMIEVARDPDTELLNRRFAFESNAISQRLLSFSLAEKTVKTLLLMIFDQQEKVKVFVFVDDEGVLDKYALSAELKRNERWIRYCLPELTGGIKNIV